MRLASILHRNRSEKSLTKIFDSDRVVAHEFATTLCKFRPRLIQAMPGCGVAGI